MEILTHTLMLLGDVNLKGVDDPSVPFRRVKDVLARADCRFANLECCFFSTRDICQVFDEGFFVAPTSAEALILGHIDGVGLANNVNYGAAPILSCCSVLQTLGIYSTGAGSNRRSAYAPTVIKRRGVRYGFLQRTSVYWPTEHAARENAPGVAVLHGHTAYEPVLYRRGAGALPANRPGVPPDIITWVDPSALAAYQADVAELRELCDVLTVSHHWGLCEDVLDYQLQIAHAAIDVGADVVMGHGPHLPLAIEVYKGKPVFYGLGNCSFRLGHSGIEHLDWLGQVAVLTFDNDELRRVAFRMVRRNTLNETLWASPSDEVDALTHLRRLCTTFGTELTVDGDEVVVSRVGSRVHNAPSRGSE
jgi:hypothetical protein